MSADVDNIAKLFRKHMESDEGAAKDIKELLLKLPSEILKKSEQRDSSLQTAVDKMLQSNARLLGDLKNCLDDIKKGQDDKHRENTSQYERMIQGQDNLKKCLDDIKNGQDELKKGHADQHRENTSQYERMIQGQDNLKKCLDDIKNGQVDLKKGQDEILSQLRGNTSQYEQMITLLQTLVNLQTSTPAEASKDKDDSSAHLYSGPSETRPPVLLKVVAQRNVAKKRKSVARIHRQHNDVYYGQHDGFQLFGDAKRFMNRK